MSAKAQPANNTHETVAHNLRRLLKKHRWSERQAAVALGISNAYINRRTKGEAEITVSDLEMFGKFLNEPRDEFFLQETKGSLAPVIPLTPRTPTHDRATLAPVTKIGA